MEKEKILSDKIDDFGLQQMIEEDRKFFKEMYLQATPWTDFKQIAFPHQKWRIHNLIPMQGFVILAAISGEGKSWIAQEMARCISSGCNFLGEEGFKTEQGKVLYLDMEMPKFEIQRRGKQLGITGENLFIFAGEELNLNSASGNGNSNPMQKLKLFIEENEITTVIVDTFRAVAGGLKEERADEVRQFFDQFKEFKDKGVVFIFLDHFRKPSRFEGKVPKKENLFSSQDKVASVEVLLMMQKDEASDEISMYQRKNRLGLEIKPFTMTIKDTTDTQGNIATSIKFGSYIEDGETKKEQAKSLIKNILAGGGKTRKEILEIALSEMIGEKNASDALRELSKLGEINTGKKKHENYYTLETEAIKDEAEENLLFE